MTYLTGNGLTPVDLTKQNIRLHYRITNIMTCR